MATGMALASGGSSTPRTQTRRHVEGFWAKRLTHEQAIGMALLNLADALQRDLSKPGTLELYTAVLADLSREQCILALCRAAEQSRFFPSPAEFRAFAGLAEPAGAGDGEAIRALSEVLAAMRQWGPDLKPKEGKITRDKDEHGLVLVVPERAPATPPPEFDQRTKFTILTLGMGDWHAGLQAISCHPALPWNTQRGLDEASARAFRHRNAAELEKRWCVAWKQAASE